MSSYSLGNVEPVGVDLSLDFSETFDTAAEAAGQAASVLLPAAAVMGGVVIAAGVAAAAGVAWGSGYLLYQAGLGVAAHVDKTRQETLEREQREQEEEKAKLFLARKETQKVQQFCQELAEHLSMRGAGPFESEARAWKTKLFEAASQEAFATSLDQEAFHQQTLALVRSFQEWNEKALEWIQREGKVQGQVQEMRTALQQMGASLAGFVPLQIEAEDVEALPPAALHLKKHYPEYLSLSIQVHAAWEKEKERARRAPVTPSHQEAVHRLFQGASEEADLLLSGTLSPKEAVRKKEALWDLLATYRILETAEDKRQEEFIHTYELYGQLCEAVGEEAIPADEFSSLKELQEAMAKVQPRVEETKEYQRLQEKKALFAKRQQLYQRLGREQYIGLALYREMKALGYPITSREDVQGYFSAGLEPLVDEKGQELPLFGMKESSVQVYRIGAHTFVTVMIHPDGSTTTETFTDLRQEDDEEMAKGEQESFCERQKKLQKALRENWFLKLDLEEKRGAAELNPCGAGYGYADEGWASQEESRQVSQNSQAKKLE